MATGKSPLIADLSQTHAVRGHPRRVRLIDLQPGHVDEYSPLWGAAIDIGTTTVTVWLVDLVSGQVKAQVSEYNGQIARGEDVISRIVYSAKEGGAEELRHHVLDTINGLVVTACNRVKAQPQRHCQGDHRRQQHHDAPAAGHPRRQHPAVAVHHRGQPPAAHDSAARSASKSIRRPASTACLVWPAMSARTSRPACFPPGLDSAENVTLFLDVGTNGEIVLGNRDWLVTCACSAGPAFEGAGVVNGMRATTGAIEEVWINTQHLRADLSRHRRRQSRSGICGSD